MALKLIETTILPTVVRMRYADQPDPASAVEWFEFQVPLAPLTAPIGPGEPLGDPELRNVAEVRLAALRYVRDVISAETQRLSNLASHIL